MKSTKRNPDGLEKNKPIALRLMPEERENAERIAMQFNISQSLLARKAYLHGLPFVTAELSQ